ncbi:hypothetical protein [Pedobacter alpinus]|uniref:Carboxypeptidase regulatory-like domain-containing protein n=1 Tax=Pedobacter alpinus TaxID=1590643 RepID=A0ABW5TSM5_9SPHI
MKSKLLLLFSVILFLSCVKEEGTTTAEKETVKIFIIASTGIYMTGSTPPVLELSGSNIETVKDINGSYILEVDYEKGQRQTLTLKSSRSDLDVFLQVSKSPTYNLTGNIIDRFAKESLTVSFIAQ